MVPVFGDIGLGGRREELYKVCRMGDPSDPSGRLFSVSDLCNMKSSSNRVVGLLDGKLVIIFLGYHGHPLVFRMYHNQWVCVDEKRDFTSRNRPETTNPLFRFSLIQVTKVSAVLSTLCYFQYLNGMKTGPS